MVDFVYHPPHYTKLDPQPIEIIESWNLGFHQANILKYVVRYQDKGGVEDLKKCRFYLDRLITIEESR